MTALHLVAENLHRVSVDGRSLVMHVPTTSLFEVDAVGGEVLDLFAEMPSVTEADVAQRFAGRHASGDVAEAIADFVRLGLIADARPDVPIPVVDLDEWPITTVVLNVNTGCNLSCTYCYKEDLAVPSAGQRMATGVAIQAIDRLISESGDKTKVNVVFFGGEPLSNMPMIREATAYALEAADKAGKRVDFSLTTNGTLLTEDLIDWFDAHAFGISVSMDGPRAIHDRHRLTIGGKGTYDVVAGKVRMLLDRYKSRRIGARVTLPHGTTEVAEIHRHLKDEMGFAEVGFAPVTAGDNALFNLTPDELSKVFQAFKDLGREYVAEALQGRNTGFSNMHQLMTDLSEGRSKKLPCGAGLGMLAVDNKGDYHLCHRFTGSKLTTFGSVGEGVATDSLEGFLNDAVESSAGSCGTCRARSICAGGCYHESYAKYGDPLAPVGHYCELIREWVDFGVESFARIQAANPGFFKTHLESRSDTQ